jgi:hypothetical protein
MLVYIHSQACYSKPAESADDAFVVTVYANDFKAFPSGLDQYTESPDPAFPRRRVWKGAKVYEALEFFDNIGFELKSVSPMDEVHHRSSQYIMWKANVE